MKKVIVIVGPTAVGKTKLSIELAKYLNTEIISGDSVQVYKHLNIGSAKVTKEESQGIKHHLIDIKELNDIYTVKDFQNDARLIIDKIYSNNKIPIICGGTGLYISSVLYNYTFIDGFEIDESLYKDKDLSSLVEELLKLDKLASLNKEELTNKRRVIKALEYYKQFNESIYLNNKKHELMYNPLIIFLNDDRDKLYNRINNRVDKMINNGLIEEVKSINKDLYKEKSLSSIGYKEIVSYLSNEITLEESKELIKKNSRNFAKRQITWFNNKMKCNQIIIDVDDFSNTINKSIELVEEFLNED